MIVISTIARLANKQRMHGPWGNECPPAHDVHICVSFRNPRFWEVEIINVVLGREEPSCLQFL